MRLFRLLLILLTLDVGLRPIPQPASLAAPNPTPAAPGLSADAWWDNAWPYRVPLTVSGSGVAQAPLNFSSLFASLGLNHALLDLRSVRVVPYTGAVPGAPIPYAETYSVSLDNADNPKIGSQSGVSWVGNTGDTDVTADHTRFREGSGSLKAVVNFRPGGYEYPGLELHITSGDPLANWSRFESLIYDVWPQVNASALDQAPDLYWFKVYGGCSGGSITQGGPRLALDRWNSASVSLNPLSNCQTPSLGAINRVEFHTRKHQPGAGRNGWYDDGDQLTLWLDDLRLVDQDSGALRWQTVPGATRYYVYFDTLAHEGHPQPGLASGLGAATLTGVSAPAEAGGYFTQVSGAALTPGLQVWSAPTSEKVLQSMIPPSAAAPLRISAARGEFEPFQVVVHDDNSADLAVSASAFTKGADTIPAPTIQRVDYVPITAIGGNVGDAYDRPGNFPDPLWPLNNGGTVHFSALVNQPLWFTLHVPWNAPPGVYQGSLSIGAAVIPVTLEVWNFSLPRSTHLLSEWGFDWSSIVEIYRGTVNGGVPNSANYWTLVDALKQDFIDHRLIPKGVAWPAGLNYPGGIDYNCNGGLFPDSWGVWGFGSLAGKYVKGQGGFNGGTGFPAFLGLGPTDNNPADSLPWSFCGVSRSGVLGSPAYQAKWTQYLSALDAYLVSSGYSAQAYYHIVNEPQNLTDYTYTGQISALTHAAAPHFKQLLSEQVEPLIYTYPGAKIDIWMPTISNYEPAKSQDRQKYSGEQVWWYYLYGDNPPLPNPILMSHPGAEARLTPWLAWAERVDGLLHYSASDWSSNPWTDPNVTGQDYGDGFFFYPPRKDNQPLAAYGANGNRLVPSIRWENLRDGMEDYEYLWLMAGGKPQVGVNNPADAYVSRLVQSRTLFSRIPTEIEAARQALGQALGGPQAAMTAIPAAVPPGGNVTFRLSYTHAGADATLSVSDTLPAGLSVLNATGPGTVNRNGQTVTWSVAVVAGQTVQLDILCQAGVGIGPLVNTATLSSPSVPQVSATVLVYAGQWMLPVIKK
jgi:hypothetical protein